MGAPSRPVLTGAIDLPEQLAFPEMGALPEERAFPEQCVFLAQSAVPEQGVLAAL